jgi:hypothetical protein
MTTRANLYIDQGTDFFTSLELETSEGVDFPIVQQEFYCQVRKVYSTSITFEADTEQVTDGVTNVLNLIVTADMTRDIEAGKYQYDVLMKSTTTGRVAKILEGLMFILPSITKIEVE